MSRSFYPSDWPDPRPGIDESLRRLAAKGWKLGLPTSHEHIEAVEAELRVPFPPDYRYFLMQCGRTSGHPSWRGLWHLDELVSLNRSLPVFQWFGGVIGIGNEGFSVCALDFRKGLPPPVVSLGLSCSEPEDVVEESATFLDWLQRSLPA